MPYVTRLNRSLIKQRTKDQLEILKAENAKKAKKLKELKLKLDTDKFIKNTIKKYNKKKPKKKRMSDLFKFPEPLHI